MLKAKKGFSLIELLVVIAIIGVLSAVGITAYSGYTADAKSKVTLAQHKQLASLINAESAKCAGGSGDFVWTEAVGGNAETCSDPWTVANIVAHANKAAGMAMGNAYTTGDFAKADTAEQGSMVITLAGTTLTLTTLLATGGTVEVSTVDRY